MPEETQIPESNGRIPPQIMEQLKKKGWTWPPSEEMRKQFREAREQFIDRSPIDPEVRREVLKSFPGRFPAADEDELD